jgi:SAM-dependent methyltransferase
MGAVKTAEPFGRRYYDKWYRHPVHKVRTPAGEARHAALAVAMAEHLLERPVRRVLDVGCGEGQWRAMLRRMRPRVHYTGLDPSPYVISRFGATRNIRLGGFGSLHSVSDLERMDLVVCVDALHYVASDDIRAGAEALGERLTGVALLHAYARGDDIEGDTGGFTFRPAAWYRATFRDAGLRELALGFWVGRELAGTLSSLERRGE